jgi:hypothetical protein
VLVRTALCTKAKGVFGVLTNGRLALGGTTASCYGYNMVMPFLLCSEVGAMGCHCRSKVVNNVVGLSRNGPHEKDAKKAGGAGNLQSGSTGISGHLRLWCAGARPPGG